MQKLTGPVSCICYIPVDELMSRLERLQKDGKIPHAIVIEHKGEHGDKTHCHLRLDAEGTNDPADFANLIGAYLFPDGEIGSCSKKWVKSDEKNFIWYCTHDPDYIRCKCPDELGKEFTYSGKDFRSTDPRLSERLQRAFAWKDWKPLSERIYLFIEECNEKDLPWYKVQRIWCVEKHFPLPLLKTGWDLWNRLHELKRYQRPMGEMEV